MEELELAPCPFCGGRGRMVVLAPTVDGGSWKSYVFCRECGASSEFAYGGNRQAAIESSQGIWNTRAE